MPAGDIPDSARNELFRSPGAAFGRCEKARSAGLDRYGIDDSRGERANGIRLRTDGPLTLKIRAAPCPSHIVVRPVADRIATKPADGGRLTGCRLADAQHANLIAAVAVSVRRAYAQKKR